MFPSRLLPCAAAVLLAGASAQAASPPTLEQLLGYPYVSELVASPHGDRFAWVENVRGVRNIWTAVPGDAAPRELTHATADDGQELTGLTFTPDGSRLLYVRGGDHDANWAAAGQLSPDPDRSATEPKVQIWAVPTDGSASATVVTDGDDPAVSARGQMAFLRDGQVWTAPLTGSATARRLFFDRGQDDSLTWSPDGSRLAFVSGRGDHSFIGIYAPDAQALVYLSPSTNDDTSPVWSPDSRSVAFLREPSAGDQPQNFLVQTPEPFSIEVADAATGDGHTVWTAPDTLDGDLPGMGDGPMLFWMANGRLIFRAQTSNWPLLYAIDPAQTGATATLLTPGSFMVETMTQSPDRKTIVYCANTGPEPNDNDRRHIFSVGADGAAPRTLTRGDGLEWSPVALAEGAAAMITAGPRQPAAVAVISHGATRTLATGATSGYPAQSLVIPQAVHFHAADGLAIEGQLFRAPGASGRQPGIIFVHGGPSRQMLLGWHPMGYYANAYAVNQYLALHGYTVLSVNYRLGIGYGHAFHDPPHAGPAGAAEYQDVLAGARYLQSLPGVDAARIGIWGGSYGGYLTGLALARNSDVFKAGVDMHGIANWIPSLAKEGGLPGHWFEADPAWQRAVATAFASSPDASITGWRSPVLLVQGDDDRNVPFDQTVELAHELEQQHTPFEELVLPNEIHGFLRWASWATADAATVRFFDEKLKPAR